MSSMSEIVDDPDEVLKQLSPVVDSYEAHTDIPWPGLCAQLLSSYPTSRFILITREPDAWWSSLSRHWNLNAVKRYMTVYEFIQYRNYIDLPRRHLVSSRDMTIFIRAYLRHTEEVIGSVPKKQLLTVDLIDPDISAKLSGFLGLDRVIQFPSVTNKTTLNPSRKFVSRLLRRGQHVLGHF